MSREHVVALSSLLSLFCLPALQRPLVKVRSLESVFSRLISRQKALSLSFFALDLTRNLVLNFLYKITTVAPSRALMLIDYTVILESEEESMDILRVSIAIRWFGRDW